MNRLSKIYWRFRLKYSHIPFFAEGYRCIYSDVGNNNIEAFRHYILFGKSEGRDNGLNPPDEIFFPTGYLEMYPDVKEAGVDPWKHYVLNGKSEGRQPAAKLSEQNYARLCKEYVENLFMTSKENFVGLSDSDIDINTISCKLIAFYLPQYHSIPLNNKYHGLGFTEWDNVTQAKPLYPGHNQPQLPIDVGFYDLSHSDVMHRQVELAKKYGISAFCFHYYWFSGEKLLDKPITNFLNDKDLKIQFCICWANENWSLRWDGGNKEIIQQQELHEYDGIKFVDDIIQFVKDPRYIKINGMPLLIIYRPSLFSKTLFLHFIEEVRTRFAFYGFPKVKILGTTAYLLDNIQFKTEDYRIDGIAEFPPHLVGFGDFRCKKNFICQYKATVIDLNKVVHNRIYFSKVCNSTYKGIFPSWDNTARKAFTGATIFENASPKIYKQWLKDIIQWTIEYHDENDRLIFINAWNEWGEGTHLEPDKKYGYAYLHATREALEETSLIENNLS